MASEVAIIVLDDDDGDDEEGPSCSPKAKESPSEPPLSDPPSSGKKDGESSQTKASMSAENLKLFEEFVDYCSKLTVKNPEVIPYLRSRFLKANVTYLSSVEFRNTLGRCLTRVQGKQTKVYVYINELCTVLKNHSDKKKIILQTSCAAPQCVKIETDIAKEEVEIENTKEEVLERKPGSKHQIRHLENLLRLYSQEIQKLQERELTLEEMDDEDSTYIQESKLKQKMIRIFEKLCDIKDCSSLTGRVIEQRVQYEGTRYKEVNRRLEKFINKTRDIFPDYNDVFQVVQKANERHNLGLARKHVQSIAQGAFRDLGNKLQHRRHLDTVYNFGCHLTDSFKSGHDPAEQDPSLSRRLRENRSLAENRLEQVIKKYVDMQDEGEEEDWKKRSKDNELPSTSKGLKLQGSPRSRKSEESEEESEESDVDIEEELRQSQEAADGEEDEESSADYVNETDQKMDTTSDLQNSSPAGTQERENEESSNSDQDGDEESVEEGTDKEDDQDLSSGSLSPEKEDLNTSLEAETPDPTSPSNSNDSELVNKTQEEQEQADVTSDDTNYGENTVEHLEMSVVEEDFDGAEERNIEKVDVPYVEADLPSSKQQGTRKCTDTQTNLVKDSKSPVIKGKFSRLDKCISKITGNRVQKVTVKTEETQAVASERERFRDVSEENPCSGDTPRTEEQNWKLVCVDTPAERWDSVRKIAFSHSPSADESSDVVRLDSCKNSTLSDTSNGVHKAMVVSPTPVNRSKRKRDLSAPTDSVFNVKVDELGTHRRKRKSSSQLWTGNGVAKYKGDENGIEKKLKVDNVNSSSYTSYSSPSEPCSDNEHDITLDLMVTCSPQMAPTKTPSCCNKTDAATQCDPDEVIVLSD